MPSTGGDCNRSADQPGQRSRYPIHRHSDALRVRAAPNGARCHGLHHRSSPIHRSSKPGSRRALGRRERLGKGNTNGLESVWSILMRAHKGTFHKISRKYLDRYVQEFSGKYNIRESGTLAQMQATVAGLIGRRLLYRDLIAHNGLCSMRR